MDESCKKYYSVHEMMESMPCELESTVYWGFSGHRFTVCCSKNNDELQRLLSNSFTYTRGGTGLSRMDALSCYLKLVSMENCLLQFWAPVTIGGKRYLTTSDQPFALAELAKGLCSYRRLCLDILIPIHDVTTEEEGRLGPPGRVFLNGLPEVCFDVRYYTSKEYPQRHDALSCGVCCCLAFPLHKSYDCKFDCVVEIVADGFQPGLYKLAKLVLRYPRFALVSVGWSEAGIEEMLQAVCDTHQLPLAQTWVSLPYQDEVRYERKGCYVTDAELHDFTEACSICRVKKGRGVVGKAFLSKEACFCENISQLSITEYSLVPSARKAGLAGCFAISLRPLTSSSWDDYVYIVEFLLPKNENGSTGGDPRNLIKMLLTTMKQHLKSLKVASGQELGEKLFVEVIKTSPTAELDSFKICDDSGIDSTPATMGLQDGEEMVQLYFTMSDAEDVIVVESGAVPGVTPGAASSYAPVDAGFSMPMQFANSPCDNHGFAGKMHEDGSKAFPAATPVMNRFADKDKDGMALVPEGAANVLSDANDQHQDGGQVGHFVNATSHSETVTNAEEDITSMEQCNTNSMGEIVQLDDASSKAKNMNIHGAQQHVVSTEKRETNSKILKNQRAVKRINREYGITSSDLLQHSGKKQNDAAAHFGVSRSTFKRICRKHQIFRWPPRKVKHDDDPCNIAQEFVQPTEETKEDSCLESPLPVKPDEQILKSKADSVRNAMTGENDSSIAVKVAYRDEMIRFDLAVPSGKMELEEEIAKRLHLSIGSFSVKYLDEDEDWISVTCDADLRTCIRIMNSFGKNKIKMLVNLP